MRIFVAIIPVALIGIAVEPAIAVNRRPEKPNRSPTATGTINLEVLGPDGKPPKYDARLLWRKVEPDASKKDLWHDPKADTWWEQAAGAAALSELEPGTYRITVRDGHNETGAIGVSDPIVIDSQHQSVATKVQLASGATLHFNCVDAKSGRPIPPPWLDLRLVEGELPSGWQFRALPVAGQSGQFEIKYLWPGTYRLKASRQAMNPVDSQYTLAAGEITLKVDGAKTISRDLQFTSSNPTQQEIERDWPFVVFGRVTDQKGQPVADAVVRAHTGFGTMFPTGATITDSNGHYRLHFAEGGISYSSGIGQAIVTASKPGMAEANLSRQGEFTLAFEQPKAGELSEWLATKPLLLVHKPAELNFTLSHVGTLAVRVHREGKKDLSGISISIKGKTMPPGCSVIDSGTTTKWGEVSFAEVPLDQPWWVEIMDSNPLRSQPFRLTDPQRYELSLELRTDTTGVEVLDITSLTDSLRVDRTLELVADDPLSHPPASAAVQQQVREWLRNIAMANKLWLAPPPAEVVHYHYDFRLADKPAQRYDVPQNRHVAGIVFHGIAYVSALARVVADPENVVTRKVDRTNGKISVSYTLRKPDSISAGNGILDNYRGFFSRPLREGILVFDPHSFQVERHETDGLIEKYSKYASLDNRQVAPRVIEVDSDLMKFRWAFELYEPGLWLLDRSLAIGPDEHDGFARIENLEINGAAPRRLHSD